MSKRIYNWQGQRFVYLGFEAEPGQTVEQQSRGLFERADAELKTLGMSLNKNVVRNRVFGRPRAARDVVSAVRGKSFTGQSRAATSSFITTTHFDSAADVALDLYAMAAPAGGVPRQVTEHTPAQPFIKHLIWGPMVFLAGMTCEDYPTLKQQYEDILPRAGTLLKEIGSDWNSVVKIAFCLHKDEDPEAL